VVRPTFHPGVGARRGVLLVDVLVGVVLLGVALAVMLGLSARAVSAQRAGENLQIAAMLIDEQLNLVLARGADDYASRYGEMEGPCADPYGQFRYVLRIQGGEGGGAYVVVCSVSWREGAYEKSASVETRIAPRLGEEPDPSRRPAESTQRVAGGAR
jgi:type II secretory pathway pseudopilin PulG